MATIPAVRLSSHTSSRGHTMPRRTTPEASITLQHHRMAREKSLRKSNGVSFLSPSDHKASSGASYGTSQSDAQKWFERSNRQHHSTMNGSSLDVDPPFYQQRSQSSNDSSRLNDGPLVAQQEQYVTPCFKQSITHSSSADDYRSVIDDLTIENKRLKEELKRYKSHGTDLLKKEKLFEVKVHGLQGRKKRELEAALRQFASSVDESNEPSSAWKKPSQRASFSISNSKHDSTSSSNSRSRPADSAYASMSTDRTSSNAVSSTKAKPNTGKAKSTEQQTYLEDIPEGLCPRSTVMAEKEKKKWVVRRLEQLFTGKMTGRDLHRNQPLPDLGLTNPEALATQVSEASREAVIEHIKLGHKLQPRDLPEASDSNGDNDSGGAESSSGSKERRLTNVSPPEREVDDQRPTRPRDLDPDRVQVPSANMDYIRHLGLQAPESLKDSTFQANDESMDAQGWIPINLLCSMAQLHIINVTPSFIRSAVSERSTKFQLSRDGRKIRWRGGTEGTRFSGESSNSSSRESPDSHGGDDGVHIMEDSPRKRMKTTAGASSDPSSNSRSKLGPQKLGSSESCHYKPLFLKHASSAGTTVDGTNSQVSYEAVEDSCSGTTDLRRKRRLDGAIVYYSGAPFCIDLSGDPGDASPQHASVNNEVADVDMIKTTRLRIQRTASGSSLAYRPLTQPDQMELDPSAVHISDDVEFSDSHEKFSFPWTTDPSKVQPRPTDMKLEPCGLGGVMPDDHFVMQVLTQHPINVIDHQHRRRTKRIKSEDTTASITGQMSLMSTKSPQTKHRDLNDTITEINKRGSPRIQVEQIAVRHKALKPYPLPPPAMFFPPFSDTGDSDNDDDDEDDDDDSLESSPPRKVKDADIDLDDDDEALDSDVMMDIHPPASTNEALSKQANPSHLDLELVTGHNASSKVSSAVMDQSDGSSDDDDDGDEEDGDDDVSIKKLASAFVRRRAPPPDQTGNASAIRRSRFQRPDSSCATAGGAQSGYSSSQESR